MKRTASSDDAAKLATARRILVLGPAGAGKTMLSRELSDLLNLPVIHLDRYFWKPGWTPSRIEDFAIEVKALADRDEWVMDGNYGQTLGHRLPRADHIIYIGGPRLRCTWAFLRRALVWRGKQRPDMADGCPDILEWKMIWSVFRQQRGHRERILGRVWSMTPSKPVTVLGSRSAASCLLCLIRSSRHV